MTTSHSKDNTSSQRQAEETLRAKYPKFYDAVFGESKNVQNGLLTASLFIMSFECLKEFVEGHFKSFFSNGFETGKDGKLVYIPSKQYPAVKAEYEQRYKEASHAERTYALPLDSLYSCAMSKAVVGGQLSTWKSAKEAYYGEVGFYAMKMTAVSPTKTLVRMSSVKEAYIDAFPQWFAELDKCGNKK